jgi:UDP-glucose 4-epimerase
MAKPKKTKYLVSGGLGFIGHHLVQQLQSQKHDIQIIDALTTYDVHEKTELEDLYNQRLKQINIKTQIYKEDVCTPEVDQVFETFKPEVLIHLADFPNADTVANNAVEAARTMCHGLANILDCAKRHNTKKFVYISTGVYEDNANVDGTYSIWKIAGEELVKQSGIPYVIVRPGEVFGPRNITTDLIGTWFKRAMANEVLYTKKKDTHDFIYVDDCVRGIILAQSAENKTYNISLNKSVSVEDVANKIIKIVKTGEVRTKGFNGVVRQLDTATAIKELKFKPAVDIDQGLKLYYKWISTKK